jgi:hypothetical protein
MVVVLTYQFGTSLPRNHCHGFPKKDLQQAPARTCPREIEGAKASFDPLTVSLTSWGHKVYYPGAKKLHIRLTADRSIGRLLGTQLVGHWESEIS